MSSNPLNSSTIKNQIPVPIFVWKHKLLRVHLYEQCNLSDIPLKFDPYLYLTGKHILTQTSLKVSHFYLYRKNENTASAIFQCISNNDQSWMSPARAPFGGIQCAADCTANDIDFLLKCIEQWILRSGGLKLSVKTCPSSYSKSMNDLLSNCFLTNHYENIGTRINHSIHVTESEFEARIHASEKRRLKKCRQAGLTCEIYEAPDAEEVYNFLHFCRTEKDYGLSMTSAQLNELFVAFPNEVKVFAVKDQHKIVALAVTIRVSNSILYYFLSSFLSSYSRYSPAVMLHETLYNFCRNEKAPILDLGVSLDQYGNEKGSLMRFKENIGAERSYKATYEKLLK